ncbi:hypothetical protein CYMTET_28833, partial [Cymbomonas tetramitiformis]
MPPPLKWAAQELDVNPQPPRASRQPVSGNVVRRNYRPSTVPNFTADTGGTEAVRRASTSAYETFRKPTPKAGRRRDGVLHRSSEGLEATGHNFSPFSSENAEEQPQGRMPGLSS